jgi:hypothetical protein
VVSLTYNGVRPVQGVKDVRVGHSSPKSLYGAAGMKEPRKSPPRESHTKAEEKLDEAIEESFPLAIRPPTRRPLPVGRRGRSVPRRARRGDAADWRRRAACALFRCPDNERAAVVARGFVELGHAHAVDVRESWPLAHFGDERFDSGRRTADQRLDCAVVSVAHPAGNAQAQRRAAGELPIADALDGAVDQDTPDDGAGFGHGAL